MSSYFDVLLIHPPSNIYFWKKPIMPGPVHRTVSMYTPLFIMFPIGMISIASYLEEKGIKTKVLNLAEKLLVEKDFDVKSFLKNKKAEIYGIDLHWVVHSSGAIEVAKICKSLHPESTVVLGGLTATCFAEEIVRDFDFVDCVIKGEGEYPLYKLYDNLMKYEKFKAFANTPNLTYKDSDGNIKSNFQYIVSHDLDSFSFTRLDLVEPHERTVTSPITGEKIWNLPFYRGCMFNCATCGGSRYSYINVMGRNKIAYRSPEKLLEDFMILDEMGFKSVFLFMDPRTCGREYLDKFFSVFKNMADKWSSITNVGIELFYPASKNYLEEWKSVRISDFLGFSISPESANEKIRYEHGRHYKTDLLLATIQHAKDLNLPLGIFFMLVLGHETLETLKEMILLWKKILSFNDLRLPRLISVDFSPMIFLDPCSPAFSYPKKFGYNLIFKKFFDYYRAMDYTHWAYWISYETENFSRFDIARVVLDCWEALINIKHKLSLMDQNAKELESLIINFERATLQEIIKSRVTTPNELEKLTAEVLDISKKMSLTKIFILTHEVGDYIINPYFYEES